MMLGGWTGCAPASAAGPFSSPQAVVLDAVSPLLGDSLLAKEPSHHVSRALAAALAVTLGPFGAHRLYLGTRPKVPLIYGLTFGGFGVLVLIDLGHILFTRDLSGYENSERIFMWVKPREEKGVTPP
jgi:hypothetical protein